jgi:hypothetical protein
LASSYSQRLQGYGSLQSSISLMVSLSNHTQQLCHPPVKISHTNHFFDTSLRPGCFYIVPKATIFP